jgi:hypothetical protein
MMTPNVRPEPARDHRRRYASDIGTGILMNHMPTENDDCTDLMQIRLMFGSIAACLLVMAMTIAMLSPGVA